jgi:hypothetical protein
LSLYIPGTSLSKCFTAKDPTDPPWINPGFQAMLTGALDTLSHTALIETVVIFREGKNDVIEAEAGDVVEVALKMLRIPHAKITHTKLHRHI